MQELSQGGGLALGTDPSPVRIDEDPGGKGADDGGEANALGQKREGETQSDPAHEQRFVRVPRAHREPDQRPGQIVTENGGPSEEEGGPQDDPDHVMRARRRPSWSRWP